MNFLDLSTDSVTLVFKVFATLILQEYVFLPMSNTSSWRRSSRYYVCPSYCALIPSKQIINLKVRLIACVLEHKTVIFFHWILFLDTNWNPMRRPQLKNGSLRLACDNILSSSLIDRMAPTHCTIPGQVSWAL